MPDSSEVGAGSLDLWKVLLVGREIDALRRVLGRDTLLAQVGHLIRQISEIALKPGDVSLVAKRARRGPARRAQSPVS